MESISDDLLKEYLEQVFEKLAAVEKELVNINLSHEPSQLLTISALIHSIKGSSGSYGLDMGSTICHNFEDFLSSLHLDQPFDSRQEKLLFGYLDLLKFYYENSHNDQIPDEDFAVKLAALNFIDNSLGLKVLLVEPSGSMARLISTALNEAGISVAICADGFSAFGRLIKEKFDALITSHKLENLDGLSLIASLKVIDCANRNIPCVLLSSANYIEVRASLRPDLILKKDVNINDHIVKHIMGYIREADFGQKNQNMAFNDPAYSSKDLNKILIIDDDIEIHKLITMAFKKNPSVQLQFLTDGQRALEEINEFSPDLVLLDYMMPVCDGAQTLQMIRAHELTKNLPVFFLSGKSRPHEIDELRALGAQYVITKPFKIVKLSQEIQEAWKNQTQ